MNPISWRISGDLGDAIFTLAIMHAMGGKHIVRCVDRPGITAPFTSRVHLLKPLFEAQPYIESVEISEDPVDLDIVPFRRFHSATTTLVAAQSTEVHNITKKYPIVDGQKPWLFVDPDKKFSERVIIARSPRYNNPWFPWSEIVNHYRDALLFVGIDKEYSAFCGQFGSVEKLNVKDFLDLAKAIAGSGFFIGNQSSPHAVAMGLGVKIIQETCLEQPDCIYKRSNVQYVGDGACFLPRHGGKPDYAVEKQLKLAIDVPKDICPPGLWQYPKLPSSTHFVVLTKLVAQLENCSLKEADVLLSRYNVQRCPEFFKGHTNNPMSFFEIALEKAQKFVATDIIKP